MNKIYYVYAYLRLDTNTYFYIGKGKNNRCTVLKGRSKPFNYIINHYPCVVEILHDNLSETEAFLLEEQIIEDLVFNECYSINIEGFNKRNTKYLVNMTWGGEGSSGRVYKVSQSTREKLRTSSLGNTNMLGKHHTAASKEKMRQSHLGKSPNMSEEQRKFRGQKIRVIRYNNGSYGCKQETRDKISKTLKGKLIGKKNGMSKAIICLNDGKIFESCRQACLYYGLSAPILSRALNYHDGIYDNLCFKWLNDYNTSND